MSYWIFKCNRDRYRIVERLMDPEPKTTWRVTRYKEEIQTGDTAFVWRTGPEIGICAAIRIESTPREIEEIECERKYVQPEYKSDCRKRMRVEATFTHRFPCISHKELRNIPGLENLSVFSGYQQTTNFKLKEEEGKILKELAKSRAALKR